MGSLQDIVIMNRSIALIFLSLILQLVDAISGRVELLTSESFKSVALNRSKYVFVYFHSSNCVNCEDFSGVISDLADVMKNRHNIIIASVDVDQEDVEEEPGSLILYKSGDNAEVRFEERSKTVKTLTSLHCRVGLSQSNSVRDRNKRYNLEHTDKFVRDEL